jgi:hypothetical protein
VTEEILRDLAPRFKQGVDEPTAGMIVGQPILGEQDADSLGNGFFDVINRGDLDSAA